MKNSPKLETTQTPIKRINPEVFVSSDNEYYSSVKRKIFSGFPGGSVVKNLPANAGDVRDVGSISGSRRSLEEGMAIDSGIHAWRIPRTEEPGHD